MSAPSLPKKTMLSAVQPSNRLTLGNYLGALKNWVRHQEDFDCLFFVVDLHSLTSRPEPQQLREQTYAAVATYLAAGIDPARVTLFVQSHVPAHAELCWILNCFSSMGELGRMTQFKDKSAKQGQSIPAALFNYPVLMAADILLYQTHLVPVGEDQKQHIELTRDLAERINHAYKLPLFTLPAPLIASVGARIMSLQNPLSKMSKSDPDPQGPVFLTDDDATIVRKFKRAVTDSGSEITDSEEQPGIRNLLQIQATLTGKSIPELVASYAGKQYGHLKVDTADLAVEAIRPLREETEKRLKDRGELDRLLAQGARQARPRAEKTLKAVYQALGFTFS